MIKLKNLYCLILSLLLIFSFSGVCYANEFSTTNNFTDECIAEVNDIKIMRSELDKRIAYKQLFGEAPTSIDENAIFNKLVEEKAAISQAAAYGVLPTEEDVIAYTKQILNGFEYSTECQEALKKLDLTYEEYLETFEYDFKYYWLCVDNIGKFLSKEAETKNLNIDQLYKEERINWKKNANIIYNPKYNYDKNKMYENFGSSFSELFSYDAPTYENNSTLLQTLSDEPTGTLFGGTKYYNLYIPDTDNGAYSIQMYLDIMGYETDSNNLKYIASTDVVVYKNAEVPLVVRNNITFGPLMGFTIYQDNKEHSELLKNFSRGYLHSRLTPLGISYGASTYGTSIGSSGHNYYAEAKIMIVASGCTFFPTVKTNTF